MRDRGPEATRSAGGKTGRHPWSVAAAVLVLMGAGWLTLTQLRNPASFETRVGEQREIKLEDGSIIHLNTRSRVEIDYTEGVRQVELREGEALFTVVRDATRPFRVVAGNTVIQAVGTQFNVYKRSHDTRVTVTEGAVDIAPSHSSPSTSASLPRLKAGEEANVTPGGIVRKAAAPHIERSIAWQKRELIFHDTALPEVIAEFNRYNRTQFTLEDGTAQTLRISGNFGADYPQSLLLYLERIPSIQVSATADRVTIRGR